MPIAGTNRQLTRGAVHEADRGKMKQRGRVAAILAAVAAGAQTSRAVADLLGESVYRIAPEMDRLSHDGRLVRCGHVAAKVGRPCVRWKAAR